MQYVWDGITATNFAYAFALLVLAYASSLDDHLIGAVMILFTTYSTLPEEKLGGLTSQIAQSTIGFCLDTAGCCCCALCSSAFLCLASIWSCWWSAELIEAIYRQCKHVLTWENACLKGVGHHFQHVPFLLTGHVAARQS